MSADSVRETKHER